MSNFIQVVLHAEMEAVSVTNGGVIEVKNAMMDQMKLIAVRKLIAYHTQCGGSQGCLLLSCICLCSIEEFASQYLDY